MATFTKHDNYTLDLCSGVHDWTSDTFKAMLTNTAPTASTDDGAADITEISAGNGYTAGGLTLTVSSVTQTSGTTTIVINDETLTATGAIGPFQYVVIYNDTSTGDRIVGSADYGSAVTLADTETFELDFAAASITH